MYPRPVSSSNTFLFFSFFANVVVSLISINQGARQFGVFPGGCFLVASAHFWHLSHRQSLDNLRVRQLSWRVMRGMLGIGGWLIDSVVKDNFNCYTFKILFEVSARF